MVDIRTCRDPAQGRGIHGLSRDEKCEYARKAVLARGRKLFSDLEVLYCHFLSDIGCSRAETAQYINNVFHAGRNVRNSDSVSYAARLYNARYH